MNTLRKKLTAIGLAGTVGVASFAIPTVPVQAAPIAPSQNSVKQSAPQQTEDVRYRRGRWVGPAVALGVLGAVAGAHYYHRRPYYDPYYPAYYAPRGYYYGPQPYYGRGYYYGW